MTLYKCFYTLLYSWGSDTPPEAIWAANDFLSYLSSKHPILEGKQFIEPYEDGYDKNNTELLELIKTLD